MNNKIEFKAFNQAKNAFIFQKRRNLLQSTQSAQIFLSSIYREFLVSIAGSHNITTVLILRIYQYLLILETQYIFLYSLKTRCRLNCFIFTKTIKSKAFLKSKHKFSIKLDIARLKQKQMFLRNKNKSVLPLTYKWSFSQSEFRRAELCGIVRNSAARNYASKIPLRWNPQFLLCLRKIFFCDNYLISIK